MFRAAAPRFAAAARPMGARAALRSTQLPARRFVSTAPPEKSRSWKNLVGRVGVLGAIIYYYNTTDVFAEEPRHAVQALPETEVESEILPTIDSIAEQRKERKAVQAQLEAQKQKQQEAAEAAQAQGGESEGGMGGLEEEADQQGAFNPETGEINWDCPCLGGMAHGPCGEEFKAAFSCFVYSTEEPKGMDCIDKFKGMQNCFREYPEVYGSELDSDADDDEDMPADGAPALSGGDVPASAASAEKATPASTSETKPVASSQRADKGKQSGEPSSKPAAASDPALELVPGNYKPDTQEQDVSPRKAFDTRAANEEVRKEESK